MLPNIYHDTEVVKIILVDKEVIFVYLDIMEVATHIKQMSNLNIKNIDPEVLAKFKAYCSLHQISVKQSLINHMVAFGNKVKLEEEEKENKK